MGVSSGNFLGFLDKYLKFQIIQNSKQTGIDWKEFQSCRVLNSIQT